MVPGTRRGRIARPSQVRLIGGTWRSRRLEFPDTAGLRPTPDRVRETVFNWLVPYLPGAACLDLFAGSGAFGFEALSRGAARAVLVERDADVVAALRSNRDHLQAAGAEIVRADAVDFLGGPARAFDIVFVDPPYGSGLLERCMRLLAERDWVKPGGFIYLEARGNEVPRPPPDWQLLRSKSAGQVGYHLCRRIDNKEPP